MLQSTILVSAIRGLRPLGAISPHVPNVTVHSHVSLFSRNVWASKVMYRGSAVNALVVLGIPPQIMPQKRSRHIWTTFFGLVARRRLPSSEGAPEGVGEVCCAKPRSRRRYQAQERFIPGSVRTAAWRETWLGPTKDFSRKYIATREISTSLRPLSAVYHVLRKCTPGDMAAYLHRVLSGGIGHRRYLKGYDCGPNSIVRNNEERS